MVEVTSTDLLHHRISGSPTLTNGKEARALLDAAFTEIGASNASANASANTPANAPAAQPPTVAISLGGVTNGNSVLVSLMLVWMRRARAVGAQVRFVDVPPLVSNLIEFSGLDDVLPMEPRGAAA
jgi:ABC-type transporter Mla MlaB component